MRHHTDEASLLAAVEAQQYFLAATEESPPMSTSTRRAARIAALVLCAAVPLGAQAHITTPKQEFGANFGDDYFLANYKQISAYWRKLDRESDRLVVQEIGKTA